MKKLSCYQLFLLLALSLLTSSAFAWERAINLGYGYSHDPNHTRYNNSGFLLTGDLYPLTQSLRTNWSISGALGQWRASTPHNKNLTTAAISLALRYYPFTVENMYPPYLLGSVGPAYISKRQFGLNKQAKNATFQFNLGLGVELKQFDINFRAVHFSNAYLAKPDQGYTILYMLAIGYLF